MDEEVEHRSGIKGKVVPIPDDYSFGDSNDPFRMASLVYVKFEDQDDGILIPESRLKPKNR